MNRIAKFEKVSYNEFKKELNKASEFGFYLPDDEIEKYYENIQLPTRSTKGSAGYDFINPISNIDLFKSHHVTIPTGIRCKIDDGWALYLVPRSGLGFKYKVTLSNTIGVIDSDYYNADNEGHILVKIVHEGLIGSVTPLTIKTGDRFCQGIFLPYGITLDDDADGIRTGGFGSTDKE